MNVRKYFREVRNKRRVHIETLRTVRDKPDTDETTRRRLNNKIAYERRQLAVIDEIWNVH